MKTKTSLTILATLGLNIVSQTLAQNLLTNGSFEFPALPSNYAQGFDSGSTNLTGWLPGGTGAITLVSAPWPLPPTNASQGQQFVDFNGGNQAVAQTLSQTFDTLIGKTYTVRFAVGCGGLAGGTMSFAIEVTSDTAAVLTNLTVIAPASFTWASPTIFRFRATSAKSTLTFRDTSLVTVSVDLLLDDVSVEPVNTVLSIRRFPLELCWDTLTGITYQLQYCSDLTTNVWTDLGAPLPGDDATHCVNDTIVPGQSRKFYRIVELP